jgi:hypothetical protein
MFIKFLVCKERRYRIEEQELARFDSYEEAENFILNYDFPDTSVAFELSIHKVYISPFYKN